MKHCEFCNEPFIAREAKQRMCCKACSIAWFAEERRAAVAAWRQSQAQRSEEHPT
jgi:hypothetical protein